MSPPLTLQSVQDVLQLQGDERLVRLEGTIVCKDIERSMMDTIPEHNMQHNSPLVCSVLPCRSRGCPSGLFNN